MAGAFLGAGFMAGCRKERTRRLRILHTNDMHSHIEAFPEDDPDHPGEGGVAHRAALVDALRKEGEEIVLLDAGDIFQGTPYFNEFDGELEFRLMSMMGYDAATMGNHDFDNGTEGFERMLPHAEFPFVTSNYDLSETPLAGKTREQLVLKRDDMRIGILGLGIELEGLVPPSRTEGVRYQEPVVLAEREAKDLKKEKECDLVIALSHLGYRYESEKVCDEDLARESRHIDLILGGHTHSFFDRPKVYRNRDKRPVVINQVGWAGLRLGRIDLEWNSRKGLEGLSALNLPIKANHSFGKRII
ncbi:MAG: bifunctional UDP-sugar hydrolase/5'-nucleotidase [Flavobacteriales bacterium]